MPQTPAPTPPVAGFDPGNANFFGLGGVARTNGGSFDNVVSTVHETGGDRTVISFDVFRSSTGVVGYEILNPSRAVVGGGFVTTTFRDGVGANVNLTANGVSIQAGDGGNALNGTGGRGGSVGNQLTLGGAGGATGTVAVTLPAFQDYRGTVELLGGNGGNGFTGGGQGGDLSGLSVRYVPTVSVLTSSAFLQAGAGGRATAGTGGRGGDVN